MQFSNNYLDSDRRLNSLIYFPVPGYYGTTALPFQAFGVGDGTWSSNGTDPMTFLGGYNPHDSYGMDGS